MKYLSYAGWIIVFIGAAALLIAAFQGINSSIPGGFVFPSMDSVVQWFTKLDFVFQLILGGGLLVLIGLAITLVQKNGQSYQPVYYQSYPEGDEEEEEEEKTETKRKKKVTSKKKKKSIPKTSTIKAKASAIRKKSYSAKKKVVKKEEEEEKQIEEEEEVEDQEQVSDQEPVFKTDGIASSSIPESTTADTKDSREGE